MEAAHAIIYMDGHNVPPSCRIGLNFLLNAYLKSLLTAKNRLPSGLLAELLVFCVALEVSAVAEVPSVVADS